MSEKDPKSKDKSKSHTKVIVFGSNRFRELILESDIIAKPNIVNIDCKCIAKVAAGTTHTLICLCDGTILCCGDNSKNQFGRKDIKSNFEKVNSLKKEMCINVACGDSYSMAITNGGALFSWGNNETGQLGRENNIDKVEIIQSLSNHFIIQVSCGHKHCLALSKDSILFSWGDNESGQLGLGNDIPQIKNPKIITSLDCLPIKQISCGRFSSIILTPSGSAYTWGSNEFGQLGIGALPSENPKSADPVYLKSIKGMEIVYICSGNNHVALLTKDGGIFTFGNGSYGQLGHGGFDHQCTPRKVADLMGSVITQISCGDDFTLVYVKSSKRIYGFGKATEGELGLDIAQGNIDIPKLIYEFMPSNHTSKSHSSNIKTGSASDTINLRRIHTGGSHTFILLTDDKYPSTVDQRNSQENQDLQIASITEKEISSLRKSGKQISNDFRSLVYVVFGSLGCLSASFLDNSEKNSHFSLTKAKHGVDIDAAYNFMTKLTELFSQDEMEMLRVNIFENMLSIRLHLRNYPAVECLRGFLILLISPFINDQNSYENLTIPLFISINNFSLSPRNILESWLSQLKPRYFKKIVECITGLVNYHLSLLPTSAPNLPNEFSVSAMLQMGAALDFMKILYNINERSKIISYTQFYVPQMTEKIDIERNFIEWATASSNYQAVPFSFCSYPFIFDGKAKTTLLHVEAGLFMRNAVLETHTNLIMSILNAQQSDVVTMENPFFVIGVSRKSILEDTLKSLESASSKDFKKPLKISFSNEEAVDDGGVVKEFFLLVIREIMLPKHGLFKCFQQSNMCYFQQSVKDKDNIYRCVGQLCGLAIYNSVIVDLHFPLALFKKLLSEVPDLEDLIELDPVLGKSMQQLLDYHDGDFHEVFGLYHDITWEDNENQVHHSELITNGKSYPVTNDNKEQYVIDYVHFILNENVSSSFDAFKLGFYLVCVGSVLRLFRPIELQEMTVGCEISDWDQLQENTKYENEYWKGHKVIVWFWAVFKELSEKDKKRFLRFLTGCDRAPITGLKDFTIVIQPTNGGDSFFPVAHTCYNLLDLPKYSSKSILKKRLMVAISYTEGFTLV